jgi:hypothetical protein
MNDATNTNNTNNAALLAQGEAALARLQVELDAAQAEVDAAREGIAKAAASGSVEELSGLVEVLRKADMTAQSLRSEASVWTAAMGFWR